MINMMILYDFVVENLCVTIVIREEGSSQLSELKSFWYRLWSTGSKTSAKCFVQKCSWRFKMDHWILSSSLSWGETHRSSSSTIPYQPALCLKRSSDTRRDENMKIRSLWFHRCFSPFWERLPYLTRRDVTNATMNHYLGSFLVVRCLGHFRCSFFEIQSIPPK